MDNFPPFLRCTRTGKGDWRCNSMVAPGRSYCAKHYHEQKIRNQRKRHRKQQQQLLLSTTTKKKIKKRSGGSDGSDGSEGEGEVSETEYLMKRVFPAMEEGNSGDVGVIARKKRRQVEALSNLPNKHTHSVNDQS